MPVPPVPNPQHESQLLAGAHADSAAPPSPSTNLDSDITDELTDHLALASRDLQLAGHTGDEAQKLAHQKFGDIAAIRRRLWWIQKGDEVMLRAALAVVLVVLVLAVAALGIGGWQISQTMNELGDTLATMNETQRALLTSRQQDDRPLAIRGRLYLGEKSKPASYASVDIYSLPEAKKVDTLMADENGRFGTSSLTAGHYAVIANLVPSKGGDGKPTGYVPDVFAVQSRPISVYPWSKDTTVELDVKMVGYGQVSIELVKPLPERFEFEVNGEMARKVAVLPVLAVVIPTISDRLPIRRLTETSDFDWPVIGLKGVSDPWHQWIFDGARPSVPVIRSIAESRGARQAPEETIVLASAENNDVFREGKYGVGAYVTFSMAVNNMSGMPLMELVDKSNLSVLPEGSRTSVEVMDGRRTHLRITPPNDLERVLRDEIISAINDAQKLQELQHKPIAVNLEVAGQMDLVEPRRDESDAPFGPGYGGYGRTGRGSYGGAR